MLSPIAQKPFARRNQGRLEVLSVPAHVRWNLADIVAADGHRLAISIACNLRSRPEPADRQLFVETFLSSSDAVSADDLARHLQPGLRATAEDLARKCPASEALTDSARSAWLAQLSKALDGGAFGCGLECLAPFEMEITSPTLQQERLEQLQRSHSERRLSDRAGQFAKAAELLKHWQSLKASLPDVNPGKLLEQISPVDRGSMLDTLLLASGAAATTATLWITAGSAVLRADFGEAISQPAVLPLPLTAGPLRSVRAVGGRVIAGGRSGLLLVDAQQPEQSRAYLLEDLSSEHGFSTTTATARHLWGVHRDAGLVAWEVNNAAETAIRLSPAQLQGEPRLITALDDDRCLFAVGSQLSVISSSGKIAPVATAPAAIVSILSDGSQWIVVGEDGTVMTLTPGTLEKTGQMRLAGRIIHAALLPWLSTSRLLLARPDAPIDCVGLEDQLVTQFGGGHTGLRTVTAAAGKVAAMTTDRQRVVLWNAWDGRIPLAEFFIAGLAKHRATDLAFG